MAAVIASATRLRLRTRVIAQIDTKTSTRMRAVPRSGCRSTRAVGTAAMSAGGSRSFSVRPSVFGSSCRYLAMATTRNSFMNSLGWKLYDPM